MTNSSAQELFSSLPREEGINSDYSYKYQGFWHRPSGLQGLIDCQQHFQARKNDIFLVTSPKSGTAWLKTILYALINRETCSPQDHLHPLLKISPHELVPFLEVLKPSDYESVSNSSDKSITRIFGSHIPTVSLPKSIMERGSSHAGPIWDHILGYWKESLERPHKVLFMRYEEMTDEPQLQLRRLAHFIGKPFSQEEDNSGLLDQIIELCSFVSMSKLEVNKTGYLMGKVRNDTFFRSGVVGDWRNHLTAEMASELDRITEEKFNGSGLSMT
ncbi:Sulfotransferase [Heracleum sosnowskyi]|uniref:Sulfotransferase n=1 Tax=Heracleum sosnowskyi TaxID=360622 RepID=A0AAD8IH20_9APIA|nr:Sulfotransferase [Heracleum sosnowskyi]